MSTENDDFFGDQNSDDKQQRDIEWNALRQEHVKAGFREGSERGHDTKMQDGFDDGFLAGAKATADAGYWFVSTRFPAQAPKLTFAGLA